jgi:hypothetical protein
MPDRSDWKTVTAKTSVRTSHGVLSRTDRAGLPPDEAEALERKGLVKIHRDTGADDTSEADVTDDYHELRSEAADIEDRTGVTPDDYKKTTLTDYVKKHRE